MMHFIELKMAAEIEFRYRQAEKELNWGRIAILIIQVSGPVHC